MCTFMFDVAIALKVLWLITRYRSWQIYGKKNVFEKRARHELVLIRQVGADVYQTPFLSGFSNWVVSHAEGVVLFYTFYHIAHH